MEKRRYRIQSFLGPKKGEGKDTFHSIFSLPLVFIAIEWKTRLLYFLKKNIFTFGTVRLQLNFPARMGASHEHTYNENSFEFKFLFSALVGIHEEGGERLKSALSFIFGGKKSLNEVRFNFFFLLQNTAIVWEGLEF